jgi:predicted peptidase
MFPVLSAPSSTDFRELSEEETSRHPVTCLLVERMLFRPAMTSRFLLAIIAMTGIASFASAQEASTPPAGPNPIDVFEAREFKGADGTMFRYRLLKPLDAASDQKYPLVVFLHGAGERGDDNEKQLVYGGRNFIDEAFRKRHPAFIVAPQCPSQQTWAPFRRGRDDDGSAEAPLQHTLELIEALEKELPIDANRIYGFGLSMGGYGTWDILRRKPNLYAAAVSICGGGIPESAKDFKSTPIWVFHGDEDDAVPVDLSRNMVKSLQDAGGRPIYTEYKGVGHDSWTRTFDNQLVWDWLFTQRKE